MSDLLQIQEPGSVAKRAAPSLHALLELGFRPLYIVGTLWALLSVLLWVHGPEWLHGVLTGSYWHAHEMLWGFVATIAVGFLFTAGASWTGITPIRGGALALFCLVWLAVRVGYLLPGPTAFAGAAIAEFLLFVWAAIAMGRAVYGARSKRNYGVPLMMLGLGLAHGLFAWALWSAASYERIMQFYSAGLVTMALIALLVARRVIPFFAMRRITGLNIPMHTQSGQWQLWATVLAVVGLLFAWGPLAAAGLALAGVLALVQLTAWRPRAVRSIPILWILYVGYAMLGLGLLTTAYEQATLGSDYAIRWAWPVHVIGVGGFSVLIIGMVTRTALGHLGRPLETDTSMVLSYWLMLLAAISRLLALALLGRVDASIYQIVLSVSACAWALALALYLWHFVPLLIRPRLNPPPPKMPAMRRKA